MKKLFAIFCAVCLMPTFSTFAWVGGPFSNNSFFSENGDDGIYEAVAFANGSNATGLFRIVVGNNFRGVNTQGVERSAPAQEAVPTVPFGTAVTIQNPGLFSGNIIFGAFGTSSNVWWYEGVSYFGKTVGTVNSVMGLVTAVGQAEETLAGEIIGGNVGATGQNQINSFFVANLSKSGKFIPATAFSGQGEATGPDGETFEFSVFGTKVSDRILFGL
ncbi:MAG: hypothetical protein WD342_14075 [Verrucomicrobiales bacterium]